jgi:hypothetical protein
MFPNVAVIFSFSDITAILRAVIAGFVVYRGRRFFSMLAASKAHYFLPSPFCFVTLLFVLNALRHHLVARVEIVYVP